MQGQMVELKHYISITTVQIATKLDRIATNFKEYTLKYSLSVSWYKTYTSKVCRMKLMKIKKNKK